MNRQTVILLCVICLLVLYLPGGGSPCPGQGLHVLYVEDRAARGSYPAEQLDAYLSADVMDQIEKAGGKRYLLDVKQPPPDEWSEKAMQIPRSELPFVVIDNNGRGWAGPVQQNLADHKAFLAGYLK